MSYLPIVRHPDEIQPTESRLYFFDTNVWLEILNPFPNDNSLKPYLSLWRRLSDAGLPFVVVNSLLVSELFNTFLRTRFNRWRKLPAVADQLLADGLRMRGEVIDYKRHYRPTKEHQDLVTLLRDEFSAYEYLMDYPEPDHDLDRVLLPRMLVNYKSDTDFNDRYYTEFCKERQIVLVTHDSDFFIGGLEVVTANVNTLKRYAEIKKPGSS